MRPPEGKNVTNPGKTQSGKGRYAAPSQQRGRNKCRERRCPTRRQIRREQDRVGCAFYTPMAGLGCTPLARAWGCGPCLVPSRGRDHSCSQEQNKLQRQQVSMRRFVPGPAGEAMTPRGGRGASPARSETQWRGVRGWRCTHRSLRAAHLGPVACGPGWGVEPRLPFAVHPTPLSNFDIIQRSGFCASCVRLHQTFSICLLCSLVWVSPSSRV